MNFRMYWIWLLLALAGCMQLPKVEGPQGADFAGKTQKGQSLVPKQELTSEILFDFLLGETALQRDNLDVAVESYTRLAKKTRDPRIAERATDIALRARRSDEAEQAVVLWIELEPDAINARQAAAALFVSIGKLEKARPHLEKLLSSDRSAADKGFMHLSRLLSRHSDKNATLKLMRQLATPYPDLPEAHFAVSQAAWAANQLELALKAMKRALALRPDWEIAAIHQGRILQKIANAEAMAFYENYLAKYPKANDMRIAYVRMLMSEKNFASARDQFEKLMVENPFNADIALAVGLLSLELNDIAGAEENFKKALDLGYEDPDNIYFNLGRIYEVTQQTEKAMEFYRQVSGGERYLLAQIRYAVLLLRKEGIGSARHHLHQLSPENDQQYAQLILAEAQLLREVNAHDEVFNLLDKGLSKIPDHPDLLYDRALAADKIGMFDITERDLRKLIELRPDNAHAYNALGYSLAERGLRLPEALALIKKAVELAPDDPYIMDSLGWVYYRMGKLNEGLNYLNLAFASRPDPEIAAHLGEVLWAKGAREDAEKIWRSALEANPGNEVLLDTMKRLMQE
ncbi:tetratricopeptide repeat protein [Nitrosomonas nitrosa]|jgi:tetratricopeptide (TPR) repeat protein|uniref:Tetratricopeptide repeat-containing protein n=2 Tax=Nitrosomonas nitrosa TaxID=52442 RepID=A0A1I4T9G4_9PROT|nr:tetratricopeptide repeat protein [Nitrosomonas nitrosa]PTR02236.1 tetratricopeptide repeat protein [Nitrosomonas nitrosa]SFM73374.1 Tetratricopeptide repeat-containing protein [Nitrosomonas nitrosa]